MRQVAACRRQRIAALQVVVEVMDGVLSVHRVPGKRNAHGWWAMGVQGVEVAGAQAGGLADVSGGRARGR